MKYTFVTPVTYVTCDIKSVMCPTRHFSVVSVSAVACVTVAMLQVWFTLDCVFSIVVVLQLRVK